MDLLKVASNKEPKLFSDQGHLIRLHAKRKPARTVWPLEGRSSCEINSPPPPHRKHKRTDKSEIRQRSVQKACTAHSSTTGTASCASAHWSHLQLYTLFPCNSVTSSVVFELITPLKCCIAVLRGIFWVKKKHLSMRNTRAFIGCLVASKLKPSFGCIYISLFFVWETFVHQTKKLKYVFLATSPMIGGA